MWKTISNILIGILVGVSVTVISQIILSNIGLMTIYFGGTKIEKLDTNEKVISKAIDLINNSKKTLSIAVDFPSVGVISHPEYFSKYSTALQSAQDRDLVRNYVWLPETAEESIANNIEKITPDNIKNAMNSSSIIRRITRANTKEIATPFLGYMNFWVSSSDSNKYESVIAFLDEPPRAQGFYTDSKEVGILLQRLQESLVRRVELDKQYCNALYPKPQ